MCPATHGVAFTTLIICMSNMTSGSVACKEHLCTPVDFCILSPVSSRLARWKLSRGSFTPAEAYERMKHHVRLLIQVLQEKARSRTRSYSLCMAMLLAMYKALQIICVAHAPVLPRQCPTQRKIWHPAFLLLKCLGLVWGISCLAFERC